MSLSVFCMHENFVTGLLFIMFYDQGTGTIEGLALTGHTSEENRSTLIGITDVKQEVDLKTNAFTRMHKLRLLKMSYVQVRGGYKHFPRKLKWLCWHGFPSDSIPMDFPLERLVALEVCNSNLKRVWNKPKVYMTLFFLLSFSQLLYIFDILVMMRLTIIYYYDSFLDI